MHNTHTHTQHSDNQIDGYGENESHIVALFERKLNVDRTTISNKGDKKNDIEVIHGILNANDKINRKRWSRGQ